MQFKIKTKYPLETSAVVYWFIFMTLSFIERIYFQQEKITAEFLYLRVLSVSIVALAYYIYNLRKELKRLKSK